MLMVMRALGWRTAIVVALVSVYLVVTAPAAEAQCIMCRTALDTPEGRMMIAALRSGILVLLAAPFAAFGCVAYFAVRSQRQLASQQEEPEA
jgi:hypothetical protein